MDAHRIIRNSLREADSHLKTYLVTPDKEKYQQVLDQSDKAKYVIDLLLNESWVRENNQKNS